MIISAGTLPYRQSPKGIEVVLVHPSGNYNAKAPWGIPKGLPNDGEDIEDAACRETLEETGYLPKDLVSLGYCDYTSGRKRVFCWASHSPKAEPRCTSWEVDRAEWLTLEDAKTVIHPAQKVFLTKLENELSKNGPS